MIEFKITKQSKKSRARVGVIKTPHGEVETPAYVGVATLGAVKTLTTEQVEQTGTQLLIANTFHLHEMPGEKIVKATGGLHKFMQWHHPLMTDSGGFQVFSLGFGKDFSTGKILKPKEDASIRIGQQPKLLRITDDGVHFTSFRDGKKFFLGRKNQSAFRSSSARTSRLRLMSARLRLRIMNIQKNRLHGLTIGQKSA